MKKSLILASVSLLLGSAGFVSCDKGGSADISNIDYVAVQTSKEKWGFVAPDGSLMFEDEFKSMPSVVYNGFFSVEKNDKYDLYKVEGNKYTELGDLVGLKSVGYFEGGLIPVCFPKQRISVYNEKGEKKFEITPVGGQEVTSVALGYSDGLLRFRTEEGKCGYLDKDGKVAVKASYDTAEDFSEGLAVVGVDTEDSSETRYSIIDTKGNVVFKLKDGQSPRGEFSKGYLVAYDGDRDVLYDTKGEIVKFPAKIHRITATNGKFVIFEDEDNETGVCDMQGEIIIRPKYSTILFNGDDGFVAWDDDESLLLNNKGEQIGRLDYKNAISFGQFGFFAGDGSRIVQIDKEGKPICKSDFYNINFFNWSACYSVNSDYFDTDGVAKAIVGLVDGNMVGTYTLGTKAATVMAGQSPSSYTYRDHISLDKLTQKGFRYEISGEGYFNASLAVGDWDYSTYEYNYYWNSHSQLGAVLLSMDAESEWGKAGFNALVSGFKAKGFKAIKDGTRSGDLAALLAKGNIFVYIQAEENDDDCQVWVGDKSVDGVEYLYDNLRSSITGTDHEPSSAVTEEVVVEEVDTI